MVHFAIPKEHFTAFFDCLRNSRTAVFVGSFRSPFAEGEAAAHADGTKNPFSVNPRTPPKAAEKTNIIAGATIIFLMSIVFVVVFIVVFSLFHLLRKKRRTEKKKKKKKKNE